MRGNMRVTWRAIEPDGNFRTVEESEALAAGKEGQGLHWVDLESDDPLTMVAWVANLGLDPDLLEAIQSPDSTGRIMPFSQATFFEFPVPDSDGSSGLVAGLVLESLVITLHGRKTGGDYDEKIVNQLQLRESTISGLVCALILAQSLRLRRSAMAMRDRVQMASLATDDNPESVLLEDILMLKRQLLILARIADEQLSVFDTLQAVSKPHLDLAHLEDSFHLALDNVQAADRRLERLDRAVMDLQRRYEGLQQDKMNRRLGFLTIISAVFMPLTLVAGIYGMNFDFMPELHFHYGYFLALGGMALMAAALLWYFRRKNWLE